ncbi:translocation/assembly module TamB domain-containing protein [Paraburkholderia bonniea]|uniref:translocation/assembly module TamB domain-containing protein n=1 Tax=Paraburkholderia bonniea TaxID=2152891 RepID=UPI0012912E62|nr:translocation/assembly module TamB domain-containing protein [Paraburkholderia bonniea]
MTTDVPVSPSPSTPDQPPPPPPSFARRWWRRLWRTCAWTVGVLVLLVALLVGALCGAVWTERGTSYAWQTVVGMFFGRLTGTLEGGTLASGIRLRQIEWRSPDANGLAFKIDHITGRWTLSRKPWRLAIESLHVGTIDLRPGAPEPESSTPLTLPQDLRLPLQLLVRDLRVEKLRLHEGTTTTEYVRLKFYGRSDGRHHEASLERLDTPFGAVNLTAKLDGVRPFALSGTLGYAGKLSNEAVQVQGQLSGSLEQLIAELDASGMKLAGHARIEATPFGAVPLQRATLAFDHVNPQAFAEGAPQADLTLRAELKPAPVSAAARAHDSKAADTSSTKRPARQTTRHAQAAAATPAAGFAVSGTVSVVNAKPGALDQNLLPLIDARTEVYLDAHTQRISNLNVRLVKRATLSGGGALAGKHGQFDLKVAGLDLNALEASLRPTQLAGPIAIRLNGDEQHLTLDLADPATALRAQASARFNPARINLERVNVSAGQGSVALTGVLNHDARSSYALKAALTDFNPLLLMAQTAATRASPAPASASAPRSAAGTQSAPASARAKARTAAAQRPPAAAPRRKIEARVNGTLNVAGTLAPQLTAQADFKLGESVYDGLPLTGSGTVQVAGTRLLPSHAALSVAGNQVNLQGSFGARGDRLRFRVDAPQLERLGFGLTGVLAADGDVTGSLAHPDLVLNYNAQNVAFGANRIGAAKGHAELRDGPNGALVFSTDASGLSAEGIEVPSLTARLRGTRANHTLEASALGKFYGRKLDLALAANGHLNDSPEGMRWNGTVSRLQNRGTPELNLEAPLALSAQANRVTLGATRLSFEGALLNLKSFVFDHGQIRSAGTLSSVALARLLALQAEISGTPSPLKTDLVFDGDWDFNLGKSASGHLQIKRREGDATVEVGRGIASLGITALAARAEFSGGNRLNATLHGQASRLGVLDVNAQTTLALRDGLLTLSEEAPVSGKVVADLPSLKTTGGLFGPSYLLDGRLSLKLTLAGTMAQPRLSGALTGDGLSATLVDQGVQLKDGVVRIGLLENKVDFQQVEFHGASGTLRAKGQVRLGDTDPDLNASIVADKLELFAAPDRQLSLSGSASVTSAGSQGGMAINGKFTVDHALFDMPEEAAPKLGDDVVIVRADGTVRGEKLPKLTNSDRPASPFAPRANIDLNLGENFRFRGQGADLGLRGTITAMSAPNQPLRAVGNVRVTQGSTYTSFGRKLAIENGFFTFNGPVANPGINILAMRRNQQVEAGVQVTGTVQSPTAKLVSEPNVADNEKLSWLLFGHGTDQGNSLGQQSAMTTALALLGSAGGKRIAQTFGLDEFSIGRSDVGLTDPQVVMVSKAINEWLVIGYEQGLQSASNAIKATVNLTRYWSVAAYGGTFQGVDLLYTRRFDRWQW